MSTNTDPFPWCDQCATWHAPTKHISASGIIVDQGQEIELLRETVRQLLRCRGVPHWDDHLEPVIQRALGHVPG